MVIYLSNKKIIKKQIKKKMIQMNVILKFFLDKLSKIAVLKYKRVIKMH